MNWVYKENIIFHCVDPTSQVVDQTTCTTSALVECPRSVLYFLMQNSTVGPRIMHADYAPICHSSTTPLHTPTQETEDSSFNIILINRTSKKWIEFEMAMLKLQQFMHSNCRPSILPFTTLCRNGSQGHEESSPICIYKWNTFYIKPLTADTLVDLNRERMTVMVNWGNTDLIISDIYIPPASSCYQTSLEHLLTNTDNFVLVAFNAHHPS